MKTQFDRQSASARWMACFAKACALLVTLSFATSLHAQTTFKAVPLDGGGWTSGFAQADNGRLYAYGDVFGAWRSDNGGTNWSYLNWNIPGGDIVGQGMAVQKDNADVVFYQSYSSIYKSTNGGSTWTNIMTPLGDNLPRFRGASPLLIRANNPNEIWYAGSRKNLTGWLWKSSDGGSTWAKAGGTSFDSVRTRTLHNIIQFPDQIWVGADDGLYVSTDGGGIFTRVTTHAEVGMIQRFATGPNAGVGLITRASVSGDGGGISRVTATDYADAATYSVVRSNTVSLYFGYPTGLQIFSDGTASAWNTSGDRHGFSNNGGVSFTVRATTLNTNPVPIWTTAAIMAAKNHPDYGTDQVIEDVTNPNKWIITGGGAAMFSLDKGFSWQYFPNGSGIAAVKTYSAGVSRHDVNRIYIPASDIGSAIVTDGGASGQATLSSSKFFTTLHSTFRVMEGPNTQSLAIAGVNQGGNANLLLKSSDGGVNWSNFNLSGSGLPASTDGITKSVMSLNDTNDFLVVLSEIGSPAQRVYRTTNGGTSFSTVSGLPDNSPTGGRYGPQNCFIERDATQDNVRYFVARGQNLYKSTNSGASWSAVTHPFGLGVWVWGMVADPVRTNNLWAAGDFGGVKVSRDGGTTWTSTPQYLNARHVSSCDGKVAVYGYKSGDPQPRLYYSMDDGATFTALTDASNNFHGVQGIMVDRTGKVWVSWNSCTVVTPEGLVPTIPVVTAGQAPTGVRGSPFNYSIQASSSPTSYANSSGALPPGLTLNTTTGAISGTPSAVGTYTPSFTATNGAGTSPPVVVTITITDPDPPVINSGLTASGLLNTAFSYTITATNSPATFAASGLPAGLSVNTSSGLISGSPSVSGVFNVSIGATNLGGTDTETLVLTITPTYTISGTVTLGGIGLGGVTITHSTGTVTTAANGTYSLTRVGGAFTLTPSLLSHSFSPSSINGTLAANLTGQDFTATFLPVTYEPFAYTAGVGALANKNGGNQWGGAWNSAANDIHATGMTYTSGGNTLVTSGGRADVKDSISSFRNLPTSYTTGTYWFSLIASSSRPGTLWGGLSLFDGNNADERIFIGQRYNTNKWSIVRSGGGTESDSAITTGSATFLLVKVVLKAGTDDVFLWPNASLASEPSEATATKILNVTDFKFDRIRIAHGLGAGFTMSFDEIRFGNTFTEVTPKVVPAPVINSSLTGSGNVGEVFNYTITASNSPSSFGSVGLPAWLTLNTSTGVITGTPTASGDYAFSISASNAGGSDTENYTLTVSSSLSLFRSTHGLAADGSQDLETPADDGVQNLLKYAFNMIGTEPGQAADLSMPNTAVLTESGVAGMPRVSTDPVTGALQVHYIRRKASSSPEITYTVEFSPNLEVAAWEIRPSAVENVTSIDATFERVTLTDSTLGAGAMFARLRITAP